MPRREITNSARESQGFWAEVFAEIQSQATADDAKLVAAGILSLIRTFPDVASRLAFLFQGTFTPESGLFDTNMLAFLQNRDPETVRRWCESRDVPVHKTGKPNSYRAADVVIASRMNGDVVDGG